MKISEIIRTTREKKGLKQKELAELSGVTNTTISYYENGTTPSWDKIILVLDALGLKIQIVEK